MAIRETLRQQHLSLNSIVFERAFSGKIHKAYETTKIQQLAVLSRPPTH